jgi:hypothetical protein
MTLLEMEQKKVKKLIQMSKNMEISKQQSLQSKLYQEEHSN